MLLADDLLDIRPLRYVHVPMAYFGYLMGYRFVHDAASDARIVTLLQRYMNDEATPTLKPVPGIDLDVYKQTLLERFANPFIGNTLARLATDASDRIPKWLLPVVRDLLDDGRSVKFSAAIVASWAVFARGVDQDGQAIHVKDRQEAAVRSAVARQQTDPVGFLRDTTLFGGLADDLVFAQAFLWALTDIDALGAARSLEALLAE